MSITADELADLEIFNGLPTEQLAWFGRFGESVELAAGDHMFERGQPADALWVVMRGLIQGFEEHGGQWLLVASTGRGQVTGMLPFSRMTHYPRHTVAAEPSRVLRLGTEHFPEMLSVSPEVGRRLVAEMSDRVRSDVRLEQQSEKMMALGRLSAGLAHELNNPASAVRRAAMRLSEHRARLPGLVMALVGHRLDRSALHALEGLRTLARGGKREPVLSAIEGSEREDEIADWMERRGVEEAWQLAATFVAAGLTPEDLEVVAATLPAGSLSDALAWASGGIESDRLVTEIAAASARITELIAAIKIYSHMDRSAEHKPTEVREGIDNTLTILQHQIKSKSITVERDYQPDLPLVPANAGELNQVWTNLIDNAVDAMDEGGHLRVRTRVNDLWVEVEILDDGPGIPADIRPKIFEPFFTTKDVGVGTGLGLGIAHRIVQTHQGHIEVRSEPGETVFCVRLPVQPTHPVAG